MKVVYKKPKYAHAKIRDLQSGALVEYRGWPCIFTDSSMFVRLTDGAEMPEDTSDSVILLNGELEISYIVAENNNKNY